MKKAKKTHKRMMNGGVAATTKPAFNKGPAISTKPAFDKGPAISGRGGMKRMADGGMATMNTPTRANRPVPAGMTKRQPIANRPVGSGTVKVPPRKIIAPPKSPNYTGVNPVVFPSSASNPVVFPSSASSGITPTIAPPQFSEPTLPSNTSETSTGITPVINPPQLMLPPQTSESAPISQQLSEPMMETMRRGGAVKSKNMRGGGLARKGVGMALAKGGLAKRAGGCAKRGFGRGRIV